MALENVAQTKTESSLNAKAVLYEIRAVRMDERYA